MNSTRIACFALSASALFLGGLLFQTLVSPAPAHAATINWQGSATVATAKIGNGEDGLFVLTGNTLSVYRSNAGSKKLELLLSQPFSFGGGKSDKEEGSRRGR